MMSQLTHFVIVSVCGLASVCVCVLSGWEFLADVVSRVILGHVFSRPHNQINNFTILVFCIKSSSCVSRKEA